jgi:hypothetical protein
MTVTTPIDQVLDDFSAAFETPSVEIVRTWIKKYPDHAERILEFAVECIRISSIEKGDREPQVDGTSVVLSALSHLHSELYKQRQGFDSEKQSRQA